MAKASRSPMSETSPKSMKGVESSIKNADADIIKTSEGNTQKRFFTAISYSLFSPSFDSEALKSQNQESLGLSALFGYSYTPSSGWGLQTSLGLLQHSKTDRSLPDFILFKPAVGILFALSKVLYVTGGVFNYIQQGQNLKNFQGYVGQEYYIGFKANKKINIKFGFTYSKFSGDFDLGSDRVNSLVSIRGIESQLVYLF
jgi:hypothetical protein